MRQSENKRGFTRVDNFTYDVILPLLSTSAQSIFLRIYRQTYGWDKKDDTISNGQFKSKCHIKDKETVVAAVRELKEWQLIIAEGKATQIKTYSINFETLISCKDRYDLGEDDVLRKLSTMNVDNSVDNFSN